MQRKPTVTVREERARERTAARITREMHEEDRHRSEAPEPQGPGATMTVKRLGRLTLEGRRGGRTVRRLVVYVAPETAARAFESARRAGKTLSDLVDEVLDDYFAKRA